MPLSKDLNSYADEEFLLIEEALISSIELTFPTLAELTVFRHRFYALRRAIIQKARQREKYKKPEEYPKHLRHPILDKADAIEFLTTTVQGTTLLIGRHVFAPRIQDNLSTISAALKERGVDPKSYRQHALKEQERTAETARLLVEQELGLSMGTPEALAAQSEAAELLKEMQLSSAAQPELTVVHTFQDGAQLTSSNEVILPNGEVVPYPIYAQRQQRDTGKEILDKKIEEIFNDKKI